MLKSLHKNRKNLYKLFKRLHSRNSNPFSTQPAINPKTTSQSQDKILKDIEQLSQLKIKVRSKQPQRAPFVKNLFLGTFDTEILSYPQLEKEDLADLNNIVKPVEDALSSGDQISRDDYINLMKTLKLTGLKVPQLLGGRELTVTENCKFDESIYNNSSIALSLLNNEHFGIQTILRFGTDEQKAKYLPLLSTGKIFSTLCVNEKGVIDPYSLKTTAELSKDKQSWILNGEKCCVINGDSADLFIVLVRTNIIGKSGFKEPRISLFLVERGFGGISHTPCKTLGIHDSGVADIKFVNTPVPVENLLGELNHGEKVAEQLLTEVRLGIGTACIPLTKNILNGLTKFTCESNIGNVCLSETDLSYYKIGKLSSWLYAMESMTYLTSLLSDQYENQDCELEAAIVKIFNSKMAHKAAVEAMDFMGPQTYLTDHWLNKLHNDALAYRLLHEPNANLEIVVALLGLQYAGLKLKDVVEKVRNPFYYSAYVFKRSWSQRRQVEDNPKLTLHLDEYLHPSLKLPAEWLEYCVLRLQFATETLLSVHGTKVVSQHMELKRIAECAIYIYAMTACLARSSRSYCIGLRNAEIEMFLTVAFCMDARSIIKENVNQIFSGRYATRDEFYEKAAKCVFHTGKYFAEHPLARNY
ncbi:acyl-CoA dehydrogenase family member 9, mitochondrial [Agrilus planipennis]|uniref:Acyl-CoA dehydrogenase family member 9, mitochondrial n=1 Tax=Agrilus planipennis TaxID=224129 RepID=A0A1W4WI49_AGRPL|nr:acyl-CoA dehydrogenase family member 9, mitochondrial [Agrilus planipennis]